MPYVDASLIVELIGEEGRRIRYIAHQHAVIVLKVHKLKLWKCIGETLIPLSWECTHVSIKDDVDLEFELLGQHLDETSVGAYADVLNVRLLGSFRLNLVWKLLRAQALNEESKLWIIDLLDLLIGLLLSRDLSVSFTMLVVLSRQKECREDYWAEHAILARYAEANVYFLAFKLVFSHMIYFRDFSEMT